MLTKQDLRQIKSIVDTSVEMKLEQQLEQKLEQKLKPIHTKIDVLDKKLSKKIDRMQKQLDTTISYFDTVTTDHEKRLKTVEKKVEVLPFVTA